MKPTFPSFFGGYSNLTQCLFSDFMAKETPEFCGFCGLMGSKKVQDEVKVLGASMARNCIFKTLAVIGNLVFYKGGYHPTPLMNHFQIGWESKRYKEIFHKRDEHNTGCLGYIALLYGDLIINHIKPL